MSLFTSLIPRRKTSLGTRLRVHHVLFLLQQLCSVLLSSGVLCTALTEGEQNHHLELCSGVHPRMGVECPRPLWGSGGCGLLDQEEDPQVRGHHRNKLSLKKGNQTPKMIHNTKQALN